MSAIGALRHRLVIEQPMRVPDGGGGATITWTALATVWGAIEPLRGGESVEAEALASRVSHRIRIRHRAGLSSDMRFRDGGRIFSIRSLNDPDGRRRWLDCLCDERAGIT